MDQMALRSFIANFLDALGHLSFTFPNTKITGRTIYPPLHPRDRGAKEEEGHPPLRMQLHLYKRSLQSSSWLFVCVAECSL